MEHPARTFLLVTMLQLCRAEISEILPGTWFSANAINDEYSPKPIAELFTTETPSFSPTKPIVVLPSVATFVPGTEVTHLPSTATSPLVSSTPIPPVSYQSTSVPTLADTFPTGFDFSQSPSISPQWSPDTSSVLQTQTTQTGTSIQTSFSPQQSTVTLPQTQTTNPNYIVIYQNAPQNIQTQPTSTKIPVVLSSSLPTTTPPTSESPERTITPYVTSSLSVGTGRPTITFRSTPKVIIPNTTPTPVVTRDLRPCNPNAKILASTSQSPLQLLNGPPKVPISPKLMIRVVAPQGSITNVKINPPTATTVPHSRRTKKPKKNSYDGCVHACRGKKDPICAIPLASLSIDTKTLKGFPSICHMACHNSYKRDVYEKLIDGRCGRLRTRIISIDSGSKVTREDLKKAEYSVINTGPKTVVEFATQSKRSIKA